MEYLDEKTQIQNKVSFNEICIQMIEALEQIHSCNYLHRDVKPDNFMIKDHRVKLIDFGLATSFANKQGQHQKRERYGFNGTPFFGSVKSL